MTQPINKKAQAKPTAKTAVKPQSKPQTKPAPKKKPLFSFGKKNKSLSAQNSIRYREKGSDGICRVDERFYSKTIRFLDINYQLAQKDDKTAIFENWCDFLNYFDSSIQVQLSFINHHTDMKEFEKMIDIPLQNDAFDDVRREYAQMLKNQLAKGNNGLVKSKFITFGIEAESIKKARPKLERIEADILGNFKVLGVTAFPLNGVERLKVLYETFNSDTQEPFRFRYDMMMQSGLTTKDYIAPSSFDFREGKYFRMGKTIGAVSYLQILAPELTDRMLAEFLDVEHDMNINLHIQSMDQTRAIKNIKSKLTDIDRMKIEEQKKAVRAGYDMDIIPSDLSTYSGEARKLLEDLQSRNERMFLVTVLMMNTAQTKQKLDNLIFRTAGIAQKYNCSLRRLDYQQEPGLMSCAPLGKNYIPINRALTTTAAAIFVPFTTQELFQDGEALYYGLNGVSNNMVMVDRKKLKNPNGLILGTPGSGKSFSAKREMTNAFLVTNDDIIVCDPEGEYYPLVNKMQGQVIRISPTSKDYVNPMDINLDYSDDENPLALKSDFILSLCELIMGGKTGLEAVEISMIDRCLPIVYQKYFANPIPENMPILGDLYDCLRSQKEDEAQRIATALEIYVHGSLNVFNHRTNIKLDNRFVCFDIKELGKQLKKIGMLMEAGNRCKDECLPEETNRRIVDIISDVNMAYSEHARRYLADCGLPKERTYVTGSPMAEVLHNNLSEIEASDIHARLGLEKGKYILLSAHREENIDTEKNFNSLFGAINKMAEKYDMPILYSCHPRSRNRLVSSGFKLDPRVIQHEPLGFHDYNCLQMNAFAVVSDSGTLPEESSFFTSIGHPFPAICIRTSTERPEALDKACFILSGIDEKGLLQSVDTAVEMNRNGDYGIPVPDYIEENVSTKVVKIIQSYTGVVDKMVWRKF